MHRNLNIRKIIHNPTSTVIAALMTEAEKAPVQKALMLNSSGPHQHVQHLNQESGKYQWQTEAAPCLWIHCYTWQTEEQSLQQQP